MLRKNNWHTNNWIYDGGICAPIAFMMLNRHWPGNIFCQNQHPKLIKNIRNHHEKKKTPKTPIKQKNKSESELQQITTNSNQSSLSSGTASLSSGTASLTSSSFLGLNSLFNENFIE